jgi:hypothetical protein
MDLWSGSVGWGGFGPELRPSGTGYRRLADQHLPAASCDRLVHVLDAAPLGCQQEQRRTIRSTEHDGEDRAGVYKKIVFAKRIQVNFLEKA